MKLLSQETIGTVNTGVALPAYDRERLKHGIVHLGLGAFHRAHQALYTEDLIARGDHRWGIVGVSLRDPRVAAALHAQDLLYSVSERHGDTVSTRVVGTLRRALVAPQALQQVLQAIANPATHIVTSTVTEKGYSLNPATLDLDLQDPGIRHDIANPQAPQTTLGVLAAGLRLRPEGAPLSLLCCDNMNSNGDTLRRLLVQFAGQFDAQLARRIEHDIGMPNSMVDRIVPAATPATLNWAGAQLGLRDEAAIVCEPFTQWVIEDRFTGPRPAWEDVGALLTSDVRPYQAMKLRLLNGTHSAIAYAGQLGAMASVSDAMQHPLLGNFARRVMLEDLLPTVTLPAGFDGRSYCTELLNRFENPTLAHRTQQIAMDGTQKVPVRWLPALRESLAAGIERPQLERALAAWLHFLASARDCKAQALVIGDPGAPALIARLQNADGPQAAVLAALGHASVFGQQPWPQAFVERLTRHLSTLRQGGIFALLEPSNFSPRH